MILTNVSEIEQVKEVIKDNILKFDRRFWLQYIRLVFMIWFAIFTLVSSFLLPIELIKYLFL